MTLPRQRPTETTDIVMVSQASREMAKPATKEIRTFAQEYDELNQQKRDIELQLGAYSQAAMLKEQQRIRRESNSSFHAWVDRKSVLDKERRALIEKKARIEARMGAIKVKATEERNAMSQGDRKPELAFVMLDVLQEMRALRKLISDHINAPKA